MAHAIHIAIIDDHRIFLDGITLLIKAIDPSYVVHQFSSPSGILHKMEAGETYDLLICDLIMSSMNGLAFLGVLRSKANKVPVLMLSGINTAPPIEDVKRLGGNGFINKSEDNLTLESAIQTVLKGGKYFADVPEDVLTEIPSIQSNEEYFERGQHETPSLGPRQTEVLQLIANGYTNKQIADALNISENTVKTHLKLIFRKLGVNKRTACVRKAQTLGII